MGVVAQRVVAGAWMLFHALRASAAASTAGGVLASSTVADLALAGGRGAADVIVRRITIPPGGSTGWHYHDGELIAFVQSGTLTRVLDDCSVQTTAAGNAFVEAAGHEHVHLGRNVGPEPVVLYVTYFLPAGSPLAVETADPGCSSFEPQP